jgi:ParB family chromosome partitioning protein
MSSNDLPRIRKESGVFWIEVDKIKPNPMQPRREFEPNALRDLSESIRQYGVLQPLVVVRRESENESGIVVEYELIAGERRLRASKLAGVAQVPVIIREEPSEQIKLELALIENIQREDLNPLERAEAFRQLVEDFKMRHHEVGQKVGKSREFVSNSLRLLSLPDEIKEGLRQGLINEGHTRPLLSLTRHGLDQLSLYKEIIYRKMTVREAEKLSRNIVQQKISKSRPSRENTSEGVQMVEKQIADFLGTRVFVEQRGQAKRVSIDFFSDEELNSFMAKLMVAGVSLPSSDNRQEEVVGVPEAENVFSEQPYGEVGGDIRAGEDFLVPETPLEEDLLSESEEKFPSEEKPLEENEEAVAPETQNEERGEYRVGDDFLQEKGRLINVIEKIEMEDDFGLTEDALYGRAGNLPAASESDVDDLRRNFTV